MKKIILFIVLSFTLSFSQTEVNNYIKAQRDLDKEQINALKINQQIDDIQNKSIDHLSSSILSLMDTNLKLLEIIKNNLCIKGTSLTLDSAKFEPRNNSLCLSGIEIKEFKEVKKFFRVIDVNEEYSYYICADNCGNNYRIITNEPVDKKLIGKKISISAELPALIGYEFKEEPRLR